MKHVKLDTVPTSHLELVSSLSSFKPRLLPRKDNFLKNPAMVSSSYSGPPDETRHDDDDAGWLPFVGSLLSHGFPKGGRARRGESTPSSPSGPRKGGEESMSGDQRPKKDTLAVDKRSREHFSPSRALISAALEVSYFTGEIVVKMEGHTHSGRRIWRDLGLGRRGRRIGRRRRRGVQCGRGQVHAFEYSTEVLWGLQVHPPRLLSLSAWLWMTFD